MICQAELAAFPIAMNTWSDYLQDTDVIAFVDNEPAKDALIHGLSSSAVSASLVQSSRAIAAPCAMAPWFARVASPANIADAPSRADFRELISAGDVEVCASPPVREPSLVPVPFECVLQ